MSDPPSGRPSSTLPPVQYKGTDLDPARGPGLGCFYVQLVLLVVLVVLTPATALAGMPLVLSGGLLVATIVLLLFAGQTIIFLLRLVAAERREGRRRPVAARGGRSATVGELEDEAGPAEPDAGVRAAPDAGAPDEPDRAGPSSDGEPPMRQ